MNTYITIDEAAWPRSTGLHVARFAKRLQAFFDGELSVRNAAPLTDAAL